MRLRPAITDALTRRLGRPVQVAVTLATPPQPTGERGGYGSVRPVGRAVVPEPPAPRESSERIEPATAPPAAAGDRYQPPLWSEPGYQSTGAPPPAREDSAAVAYARDLGRIGPARSAAARAARGGWSRGGSPTPAATG